MSSATAAAAVVASSQINFVGPFPGNLQYQATVKQSIFGDYTEAVFSYSSSTFGVFTVNADEGSNWYLVNAGDVFSPETIAANQFPVLFDASIFPPIFPPPLPIPLGNFYLGVSTGLGFTNGHPNRDVFGWLELYNTGTELIPIANAVAYNEPGIIVGTTAAAPEPASALTLLGGMIVLGLKRRKRHGL